MRSTTVFAIALFAGATATVALAASKDHRKGHREGRINAMFERLDLNKDGAVDAAEIVAARQIRFEASDANGDGKLTSEELQAAHQKRAAEQAERHSSRMIKRLDEDGDGAITKAEFDAKADRRGARMLKRLDADGDGKITKAEAEAAKSKRGHRRDHHKDDN